MSTYIHTSTYLTTAIGMYIYNHSKYRHIFGVKKAKLTTLIAQVMPVLFNTVFKQRSNDPKTLKFTT